MSQDTKPAPFNVGDHVRYVAAQRRALPAGQGNEPELVLVPGMEGVILLSSGELSDLGAAAPNPWQRWGCSRQNMARAKASRGGTSMRAPCVS